ncbi:hypothetical protein [Halostagnicola sp. A-GB9-2]|uniref:hypothetical protein n=1 Tax=Halostagnicola sp. A-GB9-2 TaxID=3048066 RepID=UPI0024BF4DC6|nr:hypothetical protein [Halostagnicola sp. A-GB9-2]MDJ1431162.1 hypothetical protein [Halostagnicola sp. A-GB9-2]
MRVAFENWDGHQQARVKTPTEHLEFSISPKDFIRHIDGETWPTRSDAKTTVFEIDRYPTIMYDRAEELEGSEELDAAVDEVWEEMKEFWWDEVEFVDEIKVMGEHTVEVCYEETKSRVRCCRGSAVEAPFSRVPSESRSVRR